MSLQKKREGGTLNFGLRSSFTVSLLAFTVLFSDGKSSNLFICIQAQDVIYGTSAYHI